MTEVIGFSCRKVLRPNAWWFTFERMSEPGVIDLRDWRNPMPPAARLTLLEHAQPGPQVVAALAEFDPRTLDDFSQVLLLKALERQRHWLDGIEQPAIAAVAGERGEKDWGREEVAAALNVSKLTAGKRVDVARMLDGPLHLTRAALQAGLISYWHAAHLAEQLAALPVDVALEVEALALPKAIGVNGRPGEGLAAFRRTVERAILTVDADYAERQRKDTRSDRRVTSWSTGNGTASVLAEGLDADAAAKLMAAIRARADQIGADDPRTLDQKMADSLVGLADATLAAANGGKGAQVVTSIVIDFDTWAGMNNNPAHMDGTGPIPAELARRISADGVFRRLIYDPTTGHLLDSTPHTYRPGAALKQCLIDRSRICDHPGCNRQAAHCDIDHTIRWADGGTTTRANLGPGCGRDHPLRHEGGWKLARQPDGTTTWTSPAGHTYLKPPWDYRPLR